MSDQSIVRLIFLNIINKPACFTENSTPKLESLFMQNMTTNPEPCQKL